MKLALALFCIIGAGSAQALELSCTYIGEGEKPITHRFSSTLNPPGPDSLFECVVPIAEPRSCGGRNYIFVQNDALGIVAVASRDKKAADFVEQKDVQAVIFTWDRATGKMQLSENNPVSGDHGADSGTCTELSR
jgi:hypothetical protein